MSKVSMLSVIALLGDKSAARGAAVQDVQAQAYRTILHGDMAGFKSTIEDLQAVKGNSKGGAAKGRADVLLRRVVAAKDAAEGLKIAKKGKATPEQEQQAKDGAAIVAERFEAALLADEAAAEKAKAEAKETAKAKKAEKEQSDEAEKARVEREAEAEARKAALEAVQQQNALTVKELCENIMAGDPDALGTGRRIAEALAAYDASQAIAQAEKDARKAAAHAALPGMIDEVKAMAKGKRSGKKPVAMAA